MIDNETNLGTLSDDELSSAINELSLALSNYQILLLNCINEREKRHTEQVTNLHAIISHVRDIGNDGNIHENESDDNISLSSNISDHSSAGKDCQGRSVYTGDLVEILTGSKNGKPFKSNEIALVRYSTGSRIRLSKLDNKSIIGFRDSKNVRLLDK